MSRDLSLEVAVFGSGCFWCAQAIFDQLRGVRAVTCGYSGGEAANPTYQLVCTGQSGHAECVRIEFEPQTISFDELLQVFFQTHDPTTLNRQGNDIGTQYRSVVFYQSVSQQRATEEMIDQLNQAGAFRATIVTAVVAAQPFYAAEPYHQGYFAANPSQRYCSAIIRPKMDKFRTRYQDLLKQTSNGGGA